MRGRAAKVPAQGAGAGDEVPARCRGSGGGVTPTRIHLYEGCRYGRSSVKDTPSHSCGTLHGVPCSSRVSLSGARPLEGARVVLFGGRDTPIASAAALSSQPFYRRWLASRGEGGRWRGGYASPEGRGAACERKSRRPGVLARAATHCPTDSGMPTKQQLPRLPSGRMGGKLRQRYLSPEGRGVTTRTSR